MSRNLLETLIKTQILLISFNNYLIKIKISLQMETKKRKKYKEKSKKKIMKNPKN